MSAALTVARTATIATRVRDRAHFESARVAMREKRYGIWREITWAEYWATTLDVAHALIALGVEPGDRVAIHSENRPEWLYVDVASVAIRAATTGLYPTNPAAEVQHVLADSGASILVAEDQEQVDKALEVADRLPSLRYIVCIDSRGMRSYDDPRLLHWDAFLELGREHHASHDGAVEQRMGVAHPDDVATLIYTSGTTGPPKGAMLSIANIEFAIRTLVQGGGFVDPPPSSDDILLSYLPLCHVAERVFTTWFSAAVGSQVNFAESIDTVQANLAEIQPTIVFGVPRIWEKMKAAIEIRASKASPLKRMNTRLWLAVARRIGRTLVARGGRHTFGTRVLYALGWVALYRPLRERVGLRLARYAASGAAPISPDVLAFFMGIGVPMHEVYGLTENAAVTTANRPGRIRLGTVGEPHRDTEVRVDEATGEILIRHPATFVGYWQKPEATAAAIDADGWLHTGDVGLWVGPGCPEGRRGDPGPDATHLRITDRLKDLIITAGGKNVSPSELENALKASPYIREAIVIGDRRKYLTALIGIERDTVGEWAVDQRLAFTTYRDLTEQAEVRRLVQREVDRANAHFSQAEQIKVFALLPKELDHEDGELTATQKVKRASIATAFSDLVESLYDGAGGATRGRHIS